MRGKRISRPRKPRKRVLERLARKFSRKHIRKGDMVKVLTGKYASRGDRRVVGRVLAVYKESDRVLVEGVNIVKRHQRPTQKIAKGGIIEKEAPIHISNVQLVCTKCDSPTRVRRERLADGKRVRVCRKCGEIIDKV